MIDEIKTIQVHKELKDELDLRKDLLTTNYVPHGGLRTASLLAAFELRTIRSSKEELKKQFLNLKSPEIIHLEEGSFVRIEDYMNLFNFAASLNKKKDHQQINIDFSKLKGLKKNNVEIW